MFNPWKPLLGLLLVLECVSLCLAHPGVSERIALIDAQLATEPDSQSLLIARAHVHSNEGHHARGLADLKAAAVLGDTPALSYAFGLIYYRLGNYPLALESLNKHLKTEPDHPAAYLHRARTFEKLQRPRRALADYRLYFASYHRPHPGEYIAAARLLTTEGEEGSALALDLLDEGMQKIGLIPQLQHLAIDIEDARGGASAAIARVRSLQTILGKSPAWKFELGQRLKSAGQEEEAMMWLSAALEQLSGLRLTPARRQMAEKIRALSIGKVTVSPTPNTQGR